MTLAGIWQYAAAHHSDIAAAVRVHALLSISALAIAAIVCIPLGIASARLAFGATVIATMNALRVVPSLALITLMLPLVGLGFAPALIALAVLACPPILINTSVAYRDVDPAIREAAFGMGMSSFGVLRRVETPLALPLVITGVRTASVEVVASAALATFVGAGGLGDLINGGLQLNDAPMLVTGALCVSLMVVAAELLLSALAGLARSAGGSAP